VLYQLSYVGTYVRCFFAKNNAPLQRGDEHSIKTFSGAGNWTRTSDLLITNQLLYQLSYASTHVERETGLEPATFSLEG
jgi:hypothetical protein